MAHVSETNRGKWLLTRVVLVVAWFLANLVVAVSIPSAVWAEGQSHRPSTWAMSFAVPESEPCAICEHGALARVSVSAERAGATHVADSAQTYDYRERARDLERERQADRARDARGDVEEYSQKRRAKERAKQDLKYLRAGQGEDQTDVTDRADNSGEDER